MTDSEIREKLYQSTRDDLLKRQLSNNENFDRAILNLSSAALAVSVAFVRGAEKLEFYLILSFSWAFLGMAVISTVVSYLVSQQSIEQQLKLAERYYIDNDLTAMAERNRPSEWHEWLTYVSAIAFVLGIMLLLLFISKNFPTA